MLDRALLALADQRDAGQDDGQGGDLIDHLRHRREPSGVQVGIEIGAQDKIDRRAAGDAARIHEVLHFVGYCGLQVGGAVAGLSYRRGVDIDLDLGLALGDDVGLKGRGYLDDEKQLAPVHFCIDVGRPDLHGRLKCRPYQPFRDLSG